MEGWEWGGWAAPRAAAAGGGKRAANEAELVHQHGREVRAAGKYVIALATDSSGQPVSEEVAKEAVQLWLEQKLPDDDGGWDDDWGIWMVPGPVQLGGGWEMVVFGPFEEEHLSRLLDSGCRYDRRVASANSTPNPSPNPNLSGKDRGGPREGGVGGGEMGVAGTDVQVWTCRYGHAGMDMQAQACKHRHAGMGMQVQACGFRHAGTDTQVWTCRYRRIGMDMQVWTCRRRHAGTAKQRE